MARLKVRTESGNEVVELTGSEVTIGRSPRNTVQIEDAAASRRHCKLDDRKSGWVLVDLGSSNGTLLNDAKVGENEERPIGHGDVIRIGKATLEFEEEVELDLGDDEDAGPSIWLIHQSGDAMGDRIELRPGTMSFGRQPKCDVVLEETGVSGQHFEIRVADGSAIVKDLGSTNGTQVNGAKIIEAPLSSGDTIQAATARFRFMTAEADEDADAGQDAGGVVVLSGEEVPKRSLVSTLVPIVLLLAIGGGGYFAYTYVNQSAPYQFPIPPEGSLIQEGWSLETPGAIEAWAPSVEGAELEIARNRAASGKVSLRLDLPDSSEPIEVAGVFQERLAIAGRSSVEVGASIEASSLTGMAGFSVRWYPTGTGAPLLREDFSRFHAGGKGFEAVRATFEPPAGASSLELRLVAFGREGRAYFDDIAVVATGQTSKDRPLESNGYGLSASAKGSFDLLRGERRLVREVQLVRFREGGEWPQSVFLVPSGESSSAHRQAGAVLLPDGTETGRVEVDASASESGFEVRYSVSEPAGVRFVLDPALAGGGITAVAGDSWNRYFRDFDNETADSLLLGDDSQLLVRFEPAMVVAVATRDGRVVCTAKPIEGSSDGSFAVRLQTTFDEERKTAQRLWIDAESARRGEELGRAISLLERIVREYPYNPEILEDAQRALRETNETAERDIVALRKQRDEADFFAAEPRYRALEAEAKRLAGRYESTRYGTEAETIASTARASADTLVESARTERAQIALAKGADLAKTDQHALARVILRAVVQQYRQTEASSRASELLQTIE